MEDIGSDNMALQIVKRCILLIIGVSVINNVLSNRFVSTTDHLQLSFLNNPSD
jgi:hypothetical protein